MKKTSFRGKSGKFARRAPSEDEESSEEEYNPDEDLRPIGTAETDARLISVSLPKLPSFGRGRAVKLVRKRSNPDSPGAPTTSSADENQSPPRLTLNAANISEDDLHRVLKVARAASQLVQNRDENDKTNVNFSID